MKKHAFIATPAYGGSVCVIYVQALIDLAVILLKNKIPCTRGYICNSALVHDARNRLVRDFLASPATDMLFIDADIGFDPYAGYRLLMSKEDVIGGAYPQKRDNLLFNVGLKPDAVTKGRLMEVDYLGTGFLKISRRAIETMIQKWPQRQYGDHQIGKGMVPAVFDTSMDNGKLQGEDVLFCRRWQECGGTVWLDPDMAFGHVGTKDYIGNFADLLRKANAA